MRPAAEITLYADYTDWPLWTSAGNLSEHALPLTEALKVRIKAWFNAYDTPRADWPLWTPPTDLPPAEQEAAWVAEGEAIRSLLEEELGEPVRFET